MMLSGLLSFSLLTSGQCVVAVPSLSSLNPSFDLSLCRAKLENDGFQVSAHRHGYTYLKELLWHCKILHLNLCWNQVADLFYPVRYQSATWRLHWRQLWTFPQSRDTWFSTRLSSISYWHRYDLLITTYNEHISLNFSAALTLFCAFFSFLLASNEHKDCPNWSRGGSRHPAFYCLVWVNLQICCNFHSRGLIEPLIW